MHVIAYCLHDTHNIVYVSFNTEQRCNGKMLFKSSYAFEVSLCIDPHKV